MDAHHKARWAARHHEGDPQAHSADGHRQLERSPRRASKRYLIVDADSKFTEQFKRILDDAGVAVVRTAFQAPNMNALAERWVLSVKTECLDKMILFGEASLRRALREYGIHFHAERPHQGLGNEIIAHEQSTGSPTGEVVESERLGALLRHYHRAAA